MTDPAHPIRAVRRRAVFALVLLGAAGCAAQPVDAPPASVIFFTSFSADLDSPANMVVDAVVKDALANPARTVIVEGFADAAGTPAAIQGLSRRRAQAVADALASKGVNRAKIVVRPRGNTGGDPGIESRRVDISFGH